MTLTRRALAALASATALVLLAASPAVAAATPPPNSMASLGDSITRGFNACGWYSDCTSRSFSTGDYSSVNSHYLRIRVVNPNIQGRNYNDAKTGAKSADMYGQAGSAVSQGVEYVTMLIGANDACTSSESTMTSVATFRANIDSALNRIKAGLPNARVAVISIPDIYRLWYVGQGSSSARTAWSLFGICQSMLANPTSTSQTDVDRRARVRQRVIDFNTQLAQACAVYGANCDFDDNAVFNYPFALNQVSTWDYFHPNTSGQAVLASISYANGFGW
ncbi:MULTISPECIES: SGNH/GDSL hydrolase family protein [Micromonospora]|uniref:SGNH/GDSL hydrolase family protein n=1 Tax=Micromonospora solifontis TaxID=2487138 RepID=A0ABX9WFV5_9ACTN|nr:MULTISPECIES: SGNH/GDSL hydrolase family protein [Micromonospora]NES13449.1 SGNH/GDSL hydrolase family protein [Micromonospora sp. PPF5-17B]NES37010.1 SGNH/GDSL hydrolase family protein [Micromonospora solifontis]NES55535.1 SGNH/GDSL hydrolase family protein [Micromonospora sp. PPF5-6]RNL98800.1 SGNH/GDSL hydrolase family protein [Micromonospora solifontis]